MALQDIRVVEPVDILLIPHAHVGYIRFHDEATVHKVPLQGFPSSRGIKFDDSCFAAAPEGQLR